ncbi:EamA family transporter [Pusillimonas sp. TS35]|uniref:DMT family transporter n=1 Tax=Paracandidimonas lactea TaxID=2895524 RepID=UPI0013707577|nr:DMT family transporter [Paracandidimonas lactea]MYN11953.1 EamA family transporter [Pusillimonas sp. TS35]
MRGEPAPALAYLCLATSMMLVGSYVALSKPLAAVFPLFLLAWLRFGIGGVAMLRWLRKPAHEPVLTPRIRMLVFLESFLGNFLFTLCMIGGVKLTGAVAAGVILSFTPAAVALMSRVFLQESISPRVWVAVCLGVVGIGLLSLSAEHGAAPAATVDYAWLGNLLLVGAVFCEAAYAVIGKTLTAVLSPRRISAIINLWGFVLTLPAGVYAAWYFDFASVGLGIWALLLFYALAASVWTVLLWMTGLRGVPASRAGVFTVLMPVTAALVGMMVLGETLSGVQWLAFALALAGLITATLPGKGGRAGRQG